MANDVPQAHEQTVTLYLRVRGGAEAVTFYDTAFGAVERPGRLAGNSEIMLSDESAEWDSPGPQMLMQRRAGAWREEHG